MHIFERDANGDSSAYIRSEMSIAKTKSALSSTIMVRF